MTELETLSPEDNYESARRKAIKWIKANMEEREKYTFEDRAEYTGLIDGFMEFFNITGEDLK